MARKKSKSNPAPTMVVATKIKERIKEREDLRCDGGLVDAVNNKVDEMLESAIDRCQANDRKTVRPSDL